MAANEAKGPTRREQVLERARTNTDLIEQEQASLEAIRRGEKGIPGPQVIAEAEERRRREREEQQRTSQEEKQPREGV